MRSPAAQILETALALHRTPGERFRLRERPLPPGIVRAIEVAAGSPQAVQAASAELGEPESVVVEAARFYLEQVLFADPEADAYRVLGLAGDATPEAIRTHHRWLQRWLHPDRAQAGDASIFATRVNQAFAQLRLPETRHAYDVRLAEARLAGAAAPLSPETVRHWGHDEDEAPRYGRRSRWLLAAALVACVVLVVLIVRNPDPGAQWDPDDIRDASAAREATRPAIEDRDLGILGAALSVPAATPDSEAPAAAPSAAPAADPAPHPAKPEHPLAAAPSANPLRALVAAALRPLHRPSEPRHGVVSAVSTVPAVRQPTSANDGRVPAAQMPAPTQAPATLQTPPQIALAPVTATAPAASPPPGGEAPPTAAPAPSPAAMSRIRSEDAALVAARLPLAEQRVAQLAGYLASRPEAVPLWDNVQAMTETNQARQRINARKGSKLELSGRAWRMRPEQASLSADYRCRSDTGVPCNGRLEVTLVWREGLWLVRGVVLGPAA